MKAIPLKCPTCSVPVELHPKQQFYKCAFCGTSFVVEFSEAEQVAQLVAFETILERVMDNTEFLAAERQLQYIDGHIDEAYDEVQTNTDRLKETNALAKTVKEQTEQELILCQAYVVGAVLGIILIWVLLVVLRASAWHLALMISVVLSIVAWKSDEKHRTLALEAPTKLAVTQEMVDGAQLLKDLADIKFQDRCLEKDLCQHKVKSYRYTGRQ